jgi:hypothetical protein
MVAFVFYWLLFIGDRFNLFHFHLRALIIMTNQPICNSIDKRAFGLSPNQNLILVFAFLLGIASAFVVDKTFLTISAASVNTAQAETMP